MPVLDSFKAALVDHAVTLIKSMTLGSTGGQASTRDGGAGNGQLTVTPEIVRLDDRTMSVSGVFGTGLTSEQEIREVVLHGDTSFDAPAFRSTFIPVTKGATVEMRVDVVLEVR